MWETSSQLRYSFDTASNLVANFLLEDYHLRQRQCSSMLDQLVKPHRNMTNSHVVNIFILPAHLPPPCIHYLFHAYRLNSAFHNIRTPYKSSCRDKLVYSCRLIRWPQEERTKMTRASGKRLRLNSLLFPLTAAQWGNPRPAPVERSFFVSMRASGDRISTSGQGRRYSGNCGG